MSSSEISLRNTICAIGQRLYQKNFVAANDGNISCRLAGDRILTTPTGVCKGDLTPENLVVTDLEGNPRSRGRPSSELPMHLFIYHNRPDVAAVVHAHPIYATAFATAGIALSECVLPEVVTTLGSIPLASYATPSTQELPESLRPYVAKYDAILLANHGAVTMGRDLWDAYFKMERLEHYAHVLFLARQLGGEKRLRAGEVEKLMAIRERYGLTGENPGCELLPETPDSGNESCGCEHPIDSRYEDLIEAILAEIRPVVLGKS